MSWRPDRWGVAPADSTTDEEKLAAILAFISEEIGTSPGYDALRILDKILNILTDA